MKVQPLRQTLLSLAGCVLFFFNTQTHADMVQLSNGDRYSGKLQSLDGSECIFITDFQSELKIPRTRITVLQTTYAVAVNLKSGERIDGLVNIQFKQESLQVRSERFGSIKLHTGELGTISTTIQSAAPSVKADEKMLATLHGKGSKDPAPGADVPIKIGEEQAEKQLEDEKIQQVFLRASGVLLEPGERQLDVSLNYIREEQSAFFSIADARAVILSNARARTFLLPVIGRFGLLSGLEGFLNVPILYQQRSETLTVGNVDGSSEMPINDESSLFSLGDVQAGLKYAFHREDGSLPEIIGTFDFRAPTGRVRNPALVSAAVTGSGQWAVAGGINLIKTFDPIILFGGLRYEYNIFNRTGGTPFSSWSALGYDMGLGFAVNDRVTLIGQFQGAYNTERNVGGIIIPEREIATLRGGLTYKIANKQYIEPSVTFGLNEISPDTIIRLSYNRPL